MRTTNYLYEVCGEDSPNCGENFFVQVNADDPDARDIANKIAAENFPDDKLRNLGRYSDFQAEMMGYDTY